MAEISFIRQQLYKANPLAEEQLRHNLYLGTKLVLTTREPLRTTPLTG
jgi:hypothetical protein